MDPMPTVEELEAMFEPTTLSYIEKVVLPVINNSGIDASYPGFTTKELIQISIDISNQGVDGKLSRWPEFEVFLMQACQTIQLVAYAELFGRPANGE